MKKIILGSWLAIKQLIVRSQIFEPNVKNKAYKRAEEWGDRFIDEQVNGNPSIGSDVAEIAYKAALSEHEDAENAHKSLTAKAHELIRVIVAFIGGYVVVVRLSPTNAQTVLDPANSIATVQRQAVVAYSNQLFMIGLLIFCIALLLALSCVRGMPYMAPIRAYDLLSMASDDASARKIRLSAAAEMYRRVVGNRATNTWIHNRLSLAAFLTTTALFIVAWSVAIRVLD